MKKYDLVSMNFGIVNEENDDLFECLINPSVNILIDESWENYNVQINDNIEVKSFQNIDDVYNYYAEFLINNKILNYNKLTLTGLLKSAKDEDEDGMHDILQEEGGELHFTRDSEIDSNFKDALFAIVQSSTIECSLKDDNSVEYDDENLNINELFGYIDDLDSSICIWID